MFNNVTPSQICARGTALRRIESRSRTPRAMSPRHRAKTVPKARVV